MGRGVMEPEYRGATARRMMREAQANAALYAKDTERVMAQRDEARAERDTLKASLAEAVRLNAVKDDALRMAQERIDSEVRIAGHLSSERDAACGALADTIEANIAAHNAAMESMKKAEDARKEATEKEATEEE